jgi:uncharacterized DUF497 family protein
MDVEFDGVEWDERKSARNEELRGFGFGEPRYIAIGSVDGLIMTVIWTPRGMKRRIVSARPSSRKEREIYRGYRDEEAL